MNPLLPIIAACISATVAIAVLVVSSLYGHLTKRHELLQDRLEKTVELAFSYRIQYGGSTSSLRELLGESSSENARQIFIAECESLAIKGATLARLYFPTLLDQLHQIALESVEFSKAFRVQNRDNRLEEVSKTATRAIGLIDMLLGEIQKDQLFLSKHPPTLLKCWLEKRLGW